MTELSNQLIDINTASIKGLSTVRGIGPSLAQAIIENRPYETVQDLVKVSGIKESKLSSLIPYITVEEKSANHRASQATSTMPSEPVSDLGETETFVFLENRRDRQDALLILLGGFIFGLVLILLRRSNR